LGLSHTLIARYLGINRSTIYKWIERGKREKTGIYKEFIDAIKSGEGKCAALNMATIQKAARGGQWTAAAWVMERRFSYSVGVDHEHLDPGTENQGDDHWETEEGMDELAEDLEALGPDLLAKIADRSPRVRRLLAEVLKGNA
tara:strand:+ start:213 stop:641 length:429 start_codon:yes stop_codon:yes gene_type:complete